MSNNLTKNNANLEPVGVIYNISATTLESFLADYFGKLGVDILTVKTSDRKIGRNSEVMVVAFFRRDSKDIISKSRGDLGIFQNKVGGSSYRASEKLRDALIPVARSGELSVSKDTIYCKLDIFKCLGMMLDVNFKYHELVMSGVQRMNDDTIIMEVVKGMRYKTKQQSYDQYRDIMNSIADR